MPHPSTWRTLVLAALLTATTAAAAPSPAPPTPPRPLVARATGVADDVLGAPSLPLLEAPSERPNIVVVMADDMRVDDLRFAPRTSRVLDRHGVRFENSFSPYPLCCPARASFLSGQYAHHHGVYWHKAPYGFAAFDDSRTLATAVRSAGYNTGFVGKYLNGYGAMSSQVTGGPSYRYVPAGWTDWAGALQRPGPGEPGRDEVVGGPYQYFSTSYNVNGDVDQRYDGTYQTGVVGDISRAMIERYHAAGAPFLLFASYVAPHHGGPTEPDDPDTESDVDGVNDDFGTPARPEWVKGRFDDEVLRASGMPADGGPAEEDVSDKPSFFSALPEPSPEELSAMTLVTRQRAEAIAVVDREVGQTVRALKRADEWGDTILVFTSDNGYFLGEHRQRTGKVRAHEPSLRVPLLVTGPGLRTGESRYDPISTVDLNATLIDIAGAEPSLTIDGASRWRTLRRGDVGWSTPVVTEATHSLVTIVPDPPDNPDGDPATPPVEAAPAPLLDVEPPSATERRRARALFDPDDPRTSIGLRTPRYSFSLYANGEAELYDLRHDPAQLENIYGTRGHARLERTLTRQWRRYRDCRGSDCLMPLPRSLRMGPAKNATLTRDYWRELTAMYGPQRWE